MNSRECRGVSGGGCGTKICGSVLAHSDIGQHEHGFIFYSLTSAVAMFKDSDGCVIKGLKNNLPLPEEKIMTSSNSTEFFKSIFFADI